MIVGVNQLEVSHLQFVDDTIHFLPGDKENFQHVLSLLQVFELVFELHIINLGKSGLARINVQEEFV